MPVVVTSQTLCITLFIKAPLPRSLTLPRHWSAKAWRRNSKKSKNEIAHDVKAEGWRGFDYVLFQGCSTAGTYKTTNKTGRFDTFWHRHHRPRILNPDVQVA